MSKESLLSTWWEGYKSKPPIDVKCQGRELNLKKFTFLHKCQTIKWSGWRQTVFCKNQSSPNMLLSWWPRSLNVLEILEFCPLSLNVLECPWIFMIFARCPWIVLEFCRSLSQNLLYEICKKKGLKLVHSRHSRDLILKNCLNHGETKA